MKFLIKFVSSLIIIITLYLLWVFLLPKTLVDEYGVKFWTYELNESILDLKKNADNFWSGASDITDSMLQIKQSQELIDNTRKTIKDTNDSIKKTQETIEEKIDQTNKVIDSTKKVIDSTSKLKEDISTLTTMSWSSDSGASNE
ncbi:MAG: hypothetical protein ACD_2C00039G0007 [uncultured bacterium (gcode 4)]|uniref:Uncharacterized protein n=1 Tax=uncultured bacterium (gcode 4) TaxID=1234023 RepID=K2G4F6_9BACT|nr:MAG: hypothetical protein ACD_2C00039G0007 [uncultured bacterium (gcode 4)]